MAHYIDPNGDGARVTTLTPIGTKVQYSPRVCRCQTGHADSSARVIEAVIVGVVNDAIVVDNAPFDGRDLTVRFACELRLTL